MTSLTNKYTAGLGLPDGRIIPPGGTVDEIDAVTLKHPVIAARIKAGHLEQGGSAKQEDEAHDGLANLTDDELRGYLEARAVKVDGRWQRERLLTEAEKLKA